MPDASYLLKRNNRFFYVRRVPEEIKEFDPRTFVRVSLKTDSRQTALTKARALNAQTENYWKSLIEAGLTHSDKDFQQAIIHCRNLGFTYLPHSSLVQERPLTELVSRLEKIEQGNFNPKQVESLWGGVDQPKIKLSETPDIFFAITKDRIIGKDNNQLRKWRNPRKRVMRDFVALVGDKEYHELTRDDCLKYRDWWIGRIETLGYKPESANKDIIHLKDMICTVADYKKIKLDEGLFKKLTLAEDKEQKRLPFETDYIKNVLLTEKTFALLTDEEKHILMAMAETGMRDAEVVNLTKDDIILDHPIPHVDIPKGKTAYSKRKIPLVGYALEAFRTYPEGFKTYQGKADQLSTNLNKSLRSRGLFPSDKHSLYSLRHSFQDRLTAVSAPERVDVGLMGHRFSRELYGNGASLEQRLEYMQKICLKE